MEQSSDRLIMCDSRDGILTVWSQGAKPVELASSWENESEVGAIYLACVPHVQKNLNAALLDLGKEQPAYLNLEKGHLPRLATDALPVKITEGAELLVEIRKDAHAKKRYSARAATFRKNDPVLVRAISLQASRCLKSTPRQWEQILAQCRREKCSVELVTDLPDIYEELGGNPPAKMPVYQRSLLERFRGEPVNAVALDTYCLFRLYVDEKLKLASIYSLETAMQSTLARRVWLPSGGNIIIERTETLTVINVNSGKDVHGRDREAILRHTNWKAAEELMRQLKPRNLSDIILVDFIDLADKADVTALTETLTALAERDSVATRFVDVIQLNLAGLIRPRRGRNLQEQFFLPSF